jgi:peptide-methionine (R)-S-oxide reductase
MNRRTALLLSLSAAALAARPSLAALAEGPFPLTRSQAEWRDRLTEAQYDVLRDAETERPYSSPLNDEMRDGIYHCQGCDQAVYDAADKYDSGTGWPSFTRSLDGAIGTMEDRSFIFQVRTECHCSRCGSHLGHIFDDGPAPTGKRHCLNGVALRFQPV